MVLLEVEALDLGPVVRAIGLELVDSETREPVRGANAAVVWSRVLPAAAGGAPWALDFFAHLDRVREYSQRHNLPFRETAGKGLVIVGIAPPALTSLLERFQGETFGARAGDPLETGDPELEVELRRRGVDAYHRAFLRYLFCAVCDFAEGSLTLLSERLWATEVMRRIRPALANLPVDVRITA